MQNGLTNKSACLTRAGTHRCRGAASSKMYRQWFSGLFADTGDRHCRLDRICILCGVTRPVAVAGTDRSAATATLARLADVLHMAAIYLDTGQHGPVSDLVRARRQCLGLQTRTILNTAPAATAKPQKINLPASSLPATSAPTAPLCAASRQHHLTLFHRLSQTMELK